MRIDGWILQAESWADLRCDFEPDPNDPFAVVVSFGGVEWRMARELLRDGLARPAGFGDIRIWPTHGPVGALFIHLRSVTGEALVELPRGRVRDFLASLPPVQIADEAFDAELRSLFRRDEDGVL